MDRLKITKTQLCGLYLIEDNISRDQRGRFSRVFCSDELRGIFEPDVIEQVNLSYTATAGTVRGMHFQRAPYQEAKVVRCVAGSIFDVVIDLRRGSPTYLKLYTRVLSGVGGEMLVIPKGYAHGFQSLEPDSIVLYLHNVAYSPLSEDGLNPLDPSLSIPWPLPVINLSARDMQHPVISSEFTGLDS